MEAKHFPVEVREGVRERVRERGDDTVTVEPVNQDNLKLGHLDKRDTFGCPNHPVYVHCNP